MQALLALRDAQLKALVELQRAAALRLGRAYALLVLEWHPTPNPRPIPSPSPGPSPQPLAPSP